MIRPLSATLVLLVLSSLDTSMASANESYPPTVFRLRGGTAFGGGGPAFDEGWIAGGSAGIALNHDALLSVGYDHLSLYPGVVSSRRRSINPVMLELEFGSPTRHRFTPRFAVGAGGYFHNEVSYPYFYGYPQRAHSLETQFGMHFGAGLSVPVWKRTLVDVDYRYHLTTGSDALDFGTLSAGLRFLFPGREADPTGYVKRETGSTAVAMR